MLPHRRRCWRTAPSRETARPIQVRPAAASAVPELSLAVKDREDEVRLAAVDALGKIGPPAREAVTALLGAIRSGDFELRRRATSSLQQIDPATAKSLAMRPAS